MHPIPALLAEQTGSRRNGHGRLEASDALPGVAGISAHLLRGVVRTRPAVIAGVTLHPPVAPAGSLDLVREISGNSRWGAQLGSDQQPSPAQVPLPTVGMVPSCLFDRICQNDAHGRCEHVDQPFPRAGVDRL